MVSEHEPVKIDAGWKLLARARSGSEEAWKSLFEQHSPQLLRMAALLIGSTDAAKALDCEKWISISYRAVCVRTDQQ